MNADLLILVKLSFAFLALFGLAEILFHWGKVQAENTRKLVHAGTGLLTLLFPIYLEHIWQVALICSAFLLLLIVSLRYRFLPSINKVERKTAGSLLYPVIVLVVFSYYHLMQQEIFFFHPYIYFYLPMLILAICDPVAAISGKWYQQRYASREGKTFFGSTGFFLAAWLIGFLFLSLYTYLSIPPLLLVSFFIAILAALSERFSNGGWDNFTIPLSVMIVLYAFTFIFKP